MRKQVHRNSEEIENCQGNKGRVNVQHILFVAEQEHAKSEARDQKWRQRPSQVGKSADDGQLEQVFYFLVPDLFHYVLERNLIGVEFDHLM